MVVASAKLYCTGMFDVHRLEKSNYFRRISERFSEDSLYFIGPDMLLMFTESDMGVKNVLTAE